MDKNYSYTDFFNLMGHNPDVNDSEKLLNDIYLDLFLNRLQRLQRIDQLKKLIDKALDEKNEEVFYQYTNELLGLQKQNDMIDDEIER